MFYRYYLNERPAGPGAVPKDGLAEYNPDDTKFNQMKGEIE